jgi:hypothetical protein
MNFEPMALGDKTEADAADYFRKMLQGMADTIRLGLAISTNEVLAMTGLSAPKEGEVKVDE